MDDESLLRLMRKTLSRDEYKALTHEYGPYCITRPNHSIARLAELLRAEVLEEAARICDRGTQVSPDRRVGVGCARCAAAIRAAKEGS